MPGIYIHIPFCKQACTYCNFHFSTSLEQKSLVLDALNKEVLLTKAFSGEPELISTVYIGGGTPSLLTVKDIEKIFYTIGQKFSIDKNAEITLEANPDDINIEKLFQWKKAGINRFSLGVQSFVEAELVWMNRAHHATESLKSIDDIIKAGFTNFSVDLIYGSPLLSDEDLLNNLEIIFQKNIPHISCYALTAEPKTVLYKLIDQKKGLAIDPEKQSRQFLLIMELMKQYGYEHYEISNFAKAGMRSRHNSSYWQGKPYYGFGPSAHSFDGKNKRRWNVANNSMYIQSLKNDVIPFEEETLTPVQQLNEFIMISLRTTEGLNLEIVRSAFGKDHGEKIITQSRKYIDGGKLKKVGNNLVLTDEGKLFADAIASDLFV